MISAWRRRSRAGRRTAKSKFQEVEELTIPTHFRCPISLDMMKDPVTISTGITYDRESIDSWFEAGNQTCPVTNQVLSNFDQIPNHSIRKMIQDWCVEHRSHGIERIPTPRIPVSAYEISAVCSKITVATQLGDQKTIGELVGKIKNWGKESERNRRCIVENGTGLVLSASFKSFASISIEENSGLLGQILSVLTWMFPLGEEGQSMIGSASSLNCIVWFLNSGDLSDRQNAVLVLKELLSLNQRHVIALAEIDGVVDTLFRIIKEPICPTATKASLMAIFYMISRPSKSYSEKIASRFVELGLITLILEILVDAERGMCERGLRVLDCICNYEQGLEMTYANDLTMPVLIKKILRVSTMATESSISIFWKLCKNGKGNNKQEGVLIEALQVGAFQKLLLLLQVGCGETTKEKATQLLKLMNLYRDTVDCFDPSTAFKHLKRPF